MKKNFILRLTMAMVAAMCVTTFTACGGDDDDTPGGEASSITIGTHRIDVDFEGNTSGWSTTVGFSAVKASSTGMGGKLYENGRELNQDAYEWAGNEFRSYSVSTDDKCQTLCCVLYVRRNAHATAEPITIRMRGYVNGNQKKEQIYVADGSHPTKVITFFSEINEGDNVQELNY